MKIIRIKFGLVVGALIFLLIFISPLVVSTQADEDDGIDEDFEKLNQRDVLVENSTGSAKIESVLTVGETQDKILVEIFIDEALNFRIKYTADAESSEIELEFNLILYDIIEYVDIDANGIYNESIDTFVQQVPIDTYRPFIYWNEVRGENTTIHIINVTTVDGIFSAQIYAVEEFERINTQLVGPTEMKMDLAIRNFNYTEDNSNLALKIGLISSGDYETEDETEDEQEGFASDEEGVKITTNQFSGFFSWNEFTIIDSIERRVNSSPVSYDEILENPIMYLSYPRGTIINHDPKIGVAGILRFPKGIDLFLIVMIVIAAITVLAVSVVMVKAEYREYLLSRILHIDSTPHRLSLEEVLENENRSIIINLILEEPGVHFNELLRRVGISAGNLAWHLDILESYKIIQKRRVGQFLVYYSFLEKNPLSNLDPKLMKSKTSLEILQLIGDNPGMYQNQIAKRLDLNHKTVKYHLEKLMEAKVIYGERKRGRQIFYPIIIPPENNEK